ncbi:MAG: DUF2070 family protein, partial [Candidatus Nanohaloarchaea archaeon]|nr:DUF2070 family protein [Candidatus Nanohaloarchaea archaeon]
RGTMSDNVDFYRRFLIRPPRLRVLVPATAALGVVFGVISVFLLSPVSSVGVNLVGAAVAALFFYTLPAFLSAEITARGTGIQRQLTYLMGIADQVIVFFFAVTIPFTDSAAEAWQVMWLGLATVYLANLTMVLMARGRRKLHWNLLYPLIYPVFVLAAFHLFIGQLVGIPRTLYLQNSVFFLISAVLLLITIANYTFIMHANIDMSALDFFPAVILGEEKELPGGIHTDVHHATLQVENGAEHTFTVPWVHPGPVDGFGGGRLTSELIDADTFPLHIPSYHTLDLADPADIDRFRPAPEPATTGQASRLEKLEENGFTLWGRRYDGGTVVYIQNRGIDDYEPSIAYDLKEEYPDLVLVDLHNQTVGEGEKWLQHMDTDRELLEAAVATMMARLDDAEMHDYRAGVGGDGGVRCLVEEVDGQRTCLLGVNASDAPQELHDIAASLEFDEVLPFTTDAHEDLFSMAAPTVDTDALQEAVDEARNDVDDAAAGVAHGTVDDVRVIGKEYEGLITTMNVMARLVPITLVLYYIGIIFLIL